MKNLLTYCFLSLISSVCAAEKVNFNQEVRPILSDRCFHCHGPDEESREKKLRLDVVDHRDGAYRIRKGKAAIKPGSLEKSEVWKRLITEDEDDIMPPLDSHKKPLTPKEKAIIKQWIEEGAEYEEFWAFTQLKKPSIPKVKDLTWSEKPIDRFVFRSFEAKSLKPSLEADKRTLIRRVTFDLTGLPPTLTEITHFLKDKSSKAYESLVNRLMSKQQYGEHMAKYWLDLVRFADSNGLHNDKFRNFYSYREWVIKAFNKNLKYDDFVKYQLAGDLYEKPTQDQLIASSFNRLHLIINVGTALPEESYTKNVIDRVTAVGTAFMGLTMECAMCHDHKFDPITQRDFYSLFAFFNNLDGKPETGRTIINGLQEPLVRFSTVKQKELMKAFNLQLTKLRKQLTDLVNKKKKEKDDEKKKTLDIAIKNIKAKEKRARSAKKKLLESIPGTMVMRETKKVKPAYILELAQYDKPGEKVERDTPKFLPPLKKKNALASRMDLAEWFVAPNNPLTARVAVNRFWQQFFGVGLVKTSEDFGAQGEVPSHPDILNYLSASFVESGWDIKALVKQIVMSKTYRQTSTALVAKFQSDPENRNLSRGSRFRMDSEMIRDQILVSSGLLSSRMYGRSVKTPQPSGLWKAVGMGQFKPDKGDAIYRRSLYSYWKRSIPPPQMTILNAPTRESCIARRERTNTPLQALLLLNESEYLKAARNLAQIALSKTSLKKEERLKYVFETITSKVPDKRERQMLLNMLKELTEEYTVNPKLAAEMCKGLKLPDQPSRVELAAWTMVASTIYNFDITKTRE